MFEDSTKLLNLKDTDVTMKIYASLLSLASNKTLPNLTPLRKLSGIHVDLLDDTIIKRNSIKFFNSIFLSKLKKINLLEFHLMVSKPRRYEKKFKNYSKIFYEMHGVSDFTCIDVDEKIPKFSKKVKRVLLMSVKAGRGGQEFNSNVFRKINLIKNQSKKIKIIVDGGIDLHNARLLSKEGIYGVVVGSSLFKGSLKDNVKEFTKFC